jgi:hypothetical protein
VNLRGTGRLLRSYVATPTGHAGYGDLWCWSRLRGGRHYGRAVHRCLIAEQGYSSARWSGFGICWRIRLDRKLATSRAWIPIA